MLIILALPSTHFSKTINHLPKEEKKWWDLWCVCDSATVILVFVDLAYRDLSCVSPVSSLLIHCLLLPISLGCDDSESSFTICEEPCPSA